MSEFGYVFSNGLNLADRFRVAGVDVDGGSVVVWADADGTPTRIDRPGLHPMARRVEIPATGLIHIEPGEAKKWRGLMTNIGWCHFTLNLWTGCSKVSEGCRNCYAEGWSKMTGRPELWGPKGKRPKSTTWGLLEKVKRLSTDDRFRVFAGLSEGESVRVFVGSLMDWAEARDAEQRAMIADFWPMAREALGVDLLMLTKRPQNALDLLPDDWGSGGYPNVWHMTSIESGEEHVKDAHLGAPVLQRALELLKIPAVVHGISYEPAIGPLAQQIKPYLHESSCWTAREPANPNAACTCYVDDMERHIKWVIYGGESGPGFRPEGTITDPKAWARDARDVCAEAPDTAFYHKQSAHRFNERGVELDGEIIHQYPRVSR